MTGTEIRTADVSVDDKGEIEVTSGREFSHAPVCAASLSLRRRRRTCRNQELPSAEDYPVRLRGVPA